MLIRYLAVILLERPEDGPSNHKIIASKYADEGDPSKKSYVKHVNQIMEKGARKLTINKRIRLKSGSDYDLHIYPNACPSLDEDFMLVFFVITARCFSRAHSMEKLLETFMNNFYDKVDSVVKNGRGVDAACQGFMTQICQEYAEDKLQRTLQQVDQVQGIMQENVEIALKNTENLRDMEEKAVNLEDKGNMFRRGAAKAKKTMRCGYYKTNIILGLLFCIIIVIIIVAASK